MDKKLLTPGPLTTSLSTKEAMLHDWGSRDKIFIDLQKRVNVFAWTNMRNVLRSFGETYYLRIQGYTSILIFYSLFACRGERRSIFF